MTDRHLDEVYSADTPEKAEAAYDGWASAYDADLMAMGYRLPWNFAACVLRHMPFGTGPILDAGCGTGLQVEPLHLLGWRGFTGVDLSTEMMEVARSKGLYDDLRQVELGTTLPFETDHFAATFCVGTMTPGHAPIETLDELIDARAPCAPLVTMGHGVSLDHARGHCTRHWPRPDPGPGEVLIKVGACGLNNTDVNTRTAGIPRPSRATTGSATGNGARGRFDLGRRADLLPAHPGCRCLRPDRGRGRRDRSRRIGERVITDNWLRDPMTRLNKDKTGYFGSERDGGFAEFTTMPAAMRWRSSPIFRMPSLRPSPAPIPPPKAC
jgi:SAM-dependent methyltransferase